MLVRNFKLVFLSVLSWRSSTYREFQRSQDRWCKKRKRKKKAWRICCLYFFPYYFGWLIKRRLVRVSVSHCETVCDCNTRWVTRKNRKAENKGVQWMLKQTSEKKRETKLHQCFQSCVKTSWKLSRITVHSLSGAVRPLQWGHLAPSVCVC